VATSNLSQSVKREGGPAQSQSVQFNSPWHFFASPPLDSPTPTPPTTPKSKTKKEIDSGQDAERGRRRREREKQEREDRERGGGKKGCRYS